MSQTKTIEAKVTGHVQGVAFRTWTRSRARKLGLTGWVRNDASGSVTTHLQGDARDVDQMLTDLWSGPAAASVRDVQSYKATPSEFADFSISR